MDLHSLDTPPSDEERAAVDAVLGPPSEVPESVVPQRTHLLPVLHALRDRVGWITRGGLGYACRRLHVAPAEAFGVASFYPLFPTTQVPPRTIHVCEDAACALRGSTSLREALVATTGTTRVLGAPCLGHCERAPAVMIETCGDTEEPRRIVAGSGPAVAAALAGLELPVPRPGPIAGPGPLTARIGVVNPVCHDDHLSHGGLLALRAAFARGPAGVRADVTAAGLLGRGGAGFPTGRKWDAVAAAAGAEKHLVCNADESEPGTFKDRVLLEGDPFAVLEAVVLASYAVGASRAWIFVRAEYPRAIAAIRTALESARASGWVGEDVLGSGHAVEIELRVGGGAYVCGEETALLEAIEGRRGEPRNKPPFPADKGLFGQPTAVNNVETLLSAAWIVREGIAAFRAHGTRDSAGTRLFSVSGDVANPGVFELDLGTPFAHLLDRAQFDTSAGPPWILLGGAAGAFVPSSQFDLPLTFEHARAAGLTLGSGAVTVLRADRARLPVLQRLAAFFRETSCGQCVPCRVGTERQEELLVRLGNGQPLDDWARERERFDLLAATMRDASICGLGQTASSALASAFALEPSLWPDHRGGAA